MASPNVTASKRPHKSKVKKHHGETPAAQSTGILDPGPGIHDGLIGDGHDVIAGFQRATAEHGGGFGMGDESVDMGSDPGDDPSGATLAELFRAADWLTDPVGAVGVGDDGGQDDSVPYETGRGGSLDFPDESLSTAISVFADPSRRQDRQLRRVRPQLSVDQIEEFFPVEADETMFYIAIEVRETVLSALLDQDAWSLEWLFGSEPLTSDTLPARSDVLALYSARDIVLQTRLQYQMWLDGVVCRMSFPLEVPSRLLFKAAQVAEASGYGQIDVALIGFIETVWRTPGISTADLVAALGDQNASDMAQDHMDAVIQGLADEFIICQNSSNGGWYFTGTNPRLRLDEERRLNGLNKRLDHFSRGWSQWW